VTRRVTEHAKVTLEGDLLQVVTIFEPGINKESVKKLNPFTKRHAVLINRRKNYEFK
jgi:hypothetical protein